METKHVFESLNNAKPVDELAIALAETDELFTDQLLCRELIYVIRHSDWLQRPINVQDILSAFHKHLTRYILLKYDKELAPELTHYVGLYGDGFRAGKFYMKEGVVHARSVWEAQGMKVDESFSVVVPNGEGDWLPYDITAMCVDCPDALDDNPDREYEGSSL